jgi:hypothetical protein
MHPLEPEAVLGEIPALDTDRPPFLGRHVFEAVDLARK